MKIRFIAVTCLGLLGCFLPAVQGFQRPGHPPLTNYDSRVATAAAKPSAAVDQAAATLKNSLPGVQIAWDELLGAPRLISASRGFLTGPSGIGKAVSPSLAAALPAGDPEAVIKAFVNGYAPLFGHDAGALTAGTVTRDYVTEHNGMHTVVWQQNVNEIPVFEALFIGHVSARGELISVASRFVREVENASGIIPSDPVSLVSQATFTSVQALGLAARHLGTEIDENLVTAMTMPDGADQTETFTAPQLRGEAQAQLRWLPISQDSLRLCWRVELYVASRPELYSLLVDVETGEVLVRRCLTEYIKPATYNVYTGDSPSPFTPGYDTPASVQPPVVSRQSVTLTALSTNASPNGWINDADSETRGNNVDAHADRNDDNAPDLPRPQGTGAARVFNFPLDLAQAPTSYTPAAVVNLFYWNNFMHDKLWELGFTEAAGNFQNNNFGRGGKGSDAVQADAQDGGGFNNANFSTPADGSPGRMQMYIFNGPTPDRDGDLDAEVMCHEYTHGLSSRLVGGGVGISALQTGGMGEGWSDFYALSLLSEASDDVDGTFPSGGYASYRLSSSFDQNYYFGIRRYPYSTSLARNPLTFKDIDPSKASAHAGVPVSPLFGGISASEVHAQGEVWCAVLWQARAALVEKFGFTTGNQLMLRLVTDGMKLSPENPTFLEARDAIIRADEVNSGGENYSELWISFAKRGMGYSAKAPPSYTTSPVYEAYDLPEGVVITVPDGFLELSLNPAANSAFFAGSTQAIFLRITDSGPVTNATISATINGTNLVFRNDGVLPDVTANNSVYSANFKVPTNLTTVTLVANISATNKESASISANFTIIGLPTNDNFTNAIKVSPSGATYVSNNKLATMENGEPAHGGVSTASSSLWWSFAPTINGPVLVDAAGSTFNSIIAVYTNTTLATLGEVASADDYGTRSSAFVVFDGRAGVTYRIAVASATPSSTGTVNLNIAPNGIPDTNAPILTVTAPLSGLTVATNRVLVTGTAVEPGPVPSGIKDVTIRVTSSSGAQTFSGLADSLIINSNWSRQVGLSEGLNTILVIASDVAGNKSETASLEVTYRPLDPANDLFVNALSLTAVPEVSSVNSTKATKEFNEPVHAGNAGGKSVWWSFQTPTNAMGEPTDGVLSLSTTNSTFDTLLAVYTGDTVSSLTRVADNDDAFGGSRFSALTLAVRSNQIYRIAVDGFDAASGVVFLHYSFTPATVYSLAISASTGGQVAPMPATVISNSTAVFTATPDQFYQFANWSGSVTSTANPLSLIVTSDVVLTAHFSPITFSDDFETGSLANLGWLTSGDIPWLVQTNTVLAGSFSARSGLIGNSQTSSLLLTTNFGGGTVSFYLKVSSEEGWDFLSFYVDGALQQQWSGEIDWTGYSIGLASGTHTLEWRYTKDATFGAGLDAAFLDNVQLPIGLPIDDTTPARLELLTQTNGSLLLQVHGQTNREYVVQGTSSLIAPIGWRDLFTNTALDGRFQFVDPGTATNSTRYYRAVAR